MRTSGISCIRCLQAAIWLLTASITLESFGAGPISSHRLANPASSSFPLHFAATGASLPDAEQIQERLQSILSRREFQKRGPSLMERLREWATYWWNKLGLHLPSIKMGKGTINTAQFLIVILAITGFLALIYYFVRRGTRNLEPEAIRKPGRDAALPLSPENYFQQAEALASAGDFRSALERTYVGTLLHLGMAERLDFHPTRTNWENLRTLQPDFPKESARSLRRISRLFDRKWYGMEALSAEDYALASRELAEVRGGARGV
jgi:hypothetical protein